jgi:hypothetical protein
MKFVEPSGFTKSLSSAGSIPRRGFRKLITNSNSDDHLDFYISHKRSEWSSFLGAAIAARWTKGQNSSILICGLSDFTWRRPRRPPLHTHRLKA